MLKIKNIAASEDIPVFCKKLNRMLYWENGTMLFLKLTQTFDVIGFNQMPIILI
ncbi:hypothetical protein [Mucilaginibacter lappiensis]|uniref:hypothetical protein n=1 Tax=Mucilaginibacter lappiensis TaxID=354630 RepID=UPI00158E585C|nr:hypothetical protein [Mucilaginibacter lappiensis]